jgi:hypothetical protein
MLNLDRVYLQVQLFYNGYSNAKKKAANQMVCTLLAKSTEEHNFLSKVHTYDLLQLMIQKTHNESYQFMKRTLCELKDALVKMSQRSSQYEQVVAFLAEPSRAKMIKNMLRGNIRAQDCLDYF